MNIELSMMLKMDNSGAIYVRPGAGTVPVPELGHSKVPVPAPGEFVPVAELGPKIAPSSGTGSCKAPRSRTGRPVPELDNDVPPQPPFQH